MAAHMHGAWARLGSSGTTACCMRISRSGVGRCLPCPRPQAAVAAERSMLPDAAGNRRTCSSDWATYVPVAAGGGGSSGENTRRPSPSSSSNNNANSSGGSSGDGAGRLCGPGSRSSGARDASSIPCHRGGSSLSSSSSSIAGSSIAERAASAAGRDGQPPMHGSAEASASGGSDGNGGQSGSAPNLHRTKPVRRQQTWRVRPAGAALRRRALRPAPSGAHLTAWAMKAVDEHELSQLLAVHPTANSASLTAMLEQLSWLHRAGASARRNNVRRLANRLVGRYRRPSPCSQCWTVCSNARRTLIYVLTLVLVLSAHVGGACGVGMPGDVWGVHAGRCVGLACRKVCGVGMPGDVWGWHAGRRVGLASRETCG
eukprot:350440-Chlamydomonas_euryale.AAC.10